MTKQTPMMRQYTELRAKYPHAILMFRLGDFYEMFGDDAEVASKELGIMLTGRDAGKGNRMPMCGVPYHAVDGYIATLVQNGHVVAIAEQVEDPKLAKGLVRREVIRVITPGTYSDKTEPNSNNFLASVICTASGSGLAWCDVSTGELATTCVAGDSPGAIAEEVARIAPAECIYPGNEGDECPIPGATVAFAVSTSDFELKNATELLLEQFNVASLEGFGTNGMELAVRAAGALVAYVRETQMNDAPQISRMRVYHLGEFMRVDAAARRALDIGGRERSFLSVLDRTCTPMGGRQIKAWLERPPVSLHEIEARHDAVGELAGNVFLLSDVRQAMGRMYDLQRTAGRIGTRSAGPRDLLALAASLEACSDLASLAAGASSARITELVKAIDGVPEVVNAVRAGISDDAPALASDGNVIKPGFSDEVDELRRAGQEGKGWLLALESRERENTGIRSLKVGFNQVFGYYIEVTKPNIHLVPQHYVRKQTLVNAERYITDELKQLETKLLGAEERLAQLESAIFEQVLEEVASHLVRIMATASAVAQLDVLASFAEAARNSNYIRPEMTEQPVTLIESGRHPVLERVLGPGKYVPNDISSDAHDGRVMIITGPNMAGKSTVLATLGLLTVMAQAGSFVPAASAKMGICDAIFYRTGSYDDLSSGKSSFMVELVEMAGILNTATERSLILVDELGRGTSTYDGMALAWAVAEWIHDHLGARTLFTTHYHELAVLEEQLPYVRNYHVGAVERGGELTFLYRLARGSVDKSYGLNVARMAGLPKEVIRRAGQLLRDIERTNADRGHQMTLFGWSDEAVDPEPSCSCDSALPVIERIAQIDPDTLSPKEALDIVYQLKSMCKEQ